MEFCPTTFMVSFSDLSQKLHDARRRGYSGVRITFHGTLEGGKSKCRASIEPPEQSDGVLVQYFDEWS